MNNERKIKRALIIGIPLVIISIIFIGVVIYISVKSNANPPKNNLTTQISQNTENLNKDKTKPITAAAGNDQHRTDKDKTKPITTAATTTKDQNSSSNNSNANQFIMPSNNSLVPSDAYAIAYANYFGTRNTSYPQILTDKQANVIKVFNLYSLDFLMSMQTLGNQALNGTTSKGNYFNQLQNVPQVLNGLRTQITNLITKGDLTGNNETIAQQYVDTLSSISGKAQNEFEIIKGSTNFSNAMITKLPFGSSLSSTIGTLKSINSQLGQGNSTATQKYRNNYEMSLPSQSLGNI